MADLDMTRLG